MTYIYWKITARGPLNTERSHSQMHLGNARASSRGTGAARCGVQNHRIHPCPVKSFVRHLAGLRHRRESSESIYGRATATFDLILCPHFSIYMIDAVASSESATRHHFEELPLRAVRRSTMILNDHAPRRDKTDSLTVQVDSTFVELAQMPVRVAVMPSRVATVTQ